MQTILPAARLRLGLALAVSLLLLSLCFAQAPPSELEQLVASLTSDPAVRGLAREFSSDLVLEAHKEVSMKEIGQKYAVIIRGDESSGAENYLFSAAVARLPQLGLIPSIPASDARIEDLKSKKLLILTGGPSQNQFAAYAEKQGWLTNKSIIGGRIVFKHGKTPWNATIVVFSDSRGYENVAMEGLRNSPIAGLVKLLKLPAQLIPVAAALASILFLAVFSVSKVYTAGVLKSKDKAKKKGIRQGFLGISAGSLRLKVREAASVFTGSVFYGSGIALAFTGISLDFLLFALVAVFAVCILYYTRAAIRLASDALFKTHTEYVVWPAGALVCLVSAFFGFTLQTPGYEIEENAAANARRLALTKSLVILVTLAVAILIFAANMAFPNKWLQVLRMAFSAIAVTEVLPLAPMPGSAIRKWNILAWLFLFLIVLPAFFLINFYL